MASPVAVSAVTTPSEGAGEARHAAAMDQERKRKRKESNRLSAQRSRARKQRQLGDLTAQMAALRARNGAMAAAAQDAERRCAAVQAENELLRARMLELSAHLQSLTDLIQCMETAAAFAAASNPFPGFAPQPPLLDAAMYCNYY